MLTKLIDGALVLVGLVMFLSLQILLADIRDLLKLLISQIGAAELPLHENGDGQPLPKDRAS